MVPIILGPGEGRSYDMGKVRALFRADEAETDCRYAVSDWIMEPGFDGVGAHSHEANDELFFVTVGSPDILVGNVWHSAKPGGFIRVPARVTHDFRNAGPERASLTNVFLPGGFERMMPQIVEWFAQNG